MSNPPALNETQLKQVNDLIGDAKSQIVSEAVGALTKKHGEVVKAAKVEIDEAVKKNQRVMVTAVRDSAAHDGSKFRGGFWEFVKILLPIFVTAYIGYLVWGWQSNIQQKIDDKSKVLESQLNEKAKVLEAQLNQKGAYFEHKLAVYEAIHKQMAEVTAKVHDARADPAKRREAFDALEAFSRLIDANRLYIPKDEVHNALTDMWQAGMDVFRKGKLDDFEDKTRAAEKALGDDIGISNLNTL